MLYLKSISHKSLKSLYSVIDPQHPYLWLFFLFLPLALSLVLLASAVSASTATLGWKSNTEPDLEGYIVYRNEGSPGPPYDYSNTLLEDELVDPLNPEVTLTGLKDNSKYYFALTAYDTSGNEGGFSNEVCVQVTEGSVGVCSKSLSPGAGSKAGSGGGSGGCFISSIMSGKPQNSKVIGMKSSGYHELVAIFFVFLFLMCSTGIARRLRLLNQRNSPINSVISPLTLCPELTCSNTNISRVSPASQEKAKRI